MYLPAATERWAKLQQNQKQFEASLSEEQRQYNQKMAASWVTGILANGQIPSSELLVAAGLSYEDAMKLVAMIAPAGGGTGKSDNDNGKNLVSTDKLLKDANNFFEKQAGIAAYTGANGIASAMGLNAENVASFNDYANIDFADSYAFAIEINQTVELLGFEKFPAFGWCHNKNKD